MLHDGILAVDDDGVIAALVEHADIYAKRVCVIDCTIHRARIRADDGHVVLFDVGTFVGDKAFEHRIGRKNVLERCARDSVVDGGVMYVESENRMHAEVLQFLERHRAVQRFASLALVLAGGIEQRHNDRYTVGLAADGAEHALDILKMLVRSHTVIAAKHCVFTTVIADVAEDINVLPPHGIEQLDLALAVGKADLFNGNEVAFVVVFLRTQLQNAFVYEPSELLTAAEDDQSEFSVVRCSHILLRFAMNLYSLFIVIAAPLNVNGIFTQILFVF